MSITQRVVRNAQAHGVTIRSRREWKSKQIRLYQWRRLNKRHAKLPADTLVQHITVTHDTGDLAADMRTLERIGMERFGSGVSYNFAVSMKTGRVGVGAALDAKGTHTLNDKRQPGYSHDQNLVAHAIAYIGMPGDKPSTAAQLSVAKLISAMIDEKALTRGFDYQPHSFFSSKDCPTDAVREVMPSIYRIGTNNTHR